MVMHVYQEYSCSTEVEGNHNFKPTDASLYHFQLRDEEDSDGDDDDRDGDAHTQMQMDGVGSRANGSGP